MKAHHDSITSKDMREREKRRDFGTSTTKKRTGFQV